MSNANTTPAPVAFTTNNGTLVSPEGYTITRIDDANGKYVHHELRLNGELIATGRQGPMRNAAAAHNAGVFGQTPETAAMAPVVNPEDEMSDEEVLEECKEGFAMMMEDVEDTCDGIYPCLLITGKPGTGKTHPVESFLRGYREENPDASTVIIGGGKATALGLLEALWNTRNKGDVLVIDDADGAFDSVDKQNLLKGAADSKRRRLISYMSQGKQLAELGIDPQFEYCGSIIIISNADLAGKADAGNGHIGAIVSRAQHVDLGISSKRAMSIWVSYMLRTKEMLAQSFAEQGIVGKEYEKARDEIAQFIVDNRDAMREVTLREADKIGRMFIASYLKGRGDRWKVRAERRYGVGRK